MEQSPLSTTYQISEAYLKKTKKSYLYMLISIPLGMVAITLLMKLGSSSTLLWGFLLGFILFLELEVLIVSRVMLSKIKKNQLILGETSFQRISGKPERPIPYVDLQSLMVRREKDGSLRFITIQLPDKKVTLYGFEQLELILETLTAHAPGLPFTEKTYRHNYDSPLSYTVIFAVALAVFFGANQFFNIPLSELFLLGFGVWFVFWKPISRAQGQRFRWLELLLGVLMIAMNLILI